MICSACYLDYSPDEGSDSNCPSCGSPPKGYLVSHCASCGGSGQKTMLDTIIPCDRCGNYWKKK